MICAKPRYHISLLQWTNLKSWTWEFGPQWTKTKQEKLPWPALWFMGRLDQIVRTSVESRLQPTGQTYASSYLKNLLAQAWMRESLFLLLCVVSRSNRSVESGHRLNVINYPLSFFRRLCLIVLIKDQDVRLSPETTASMVQHNHFLTMTLVRDNYMVCSDVQPS